MSAFDSESARAVEHSAANEHSTVFPTRTRARVLVVDDELLIVRSVTRTLIAHEVVAVTCGQDAIALLDAGETFDVVLCDLMMPDLDGTQVYEMVRRSHPHMIDRFVFMTGGAYSEESRSFMNVHADRQLEKPFSSDALRQCVVEMLRAQPRR